MSEQREFPPLVSETKPGAQGIIWFPPMLIKGFRQFVVRTVKHNPEYVGTEQFDIAGNLDILRYIAAGEWRDEARRLRAVISEFSIGEAGPALEAERNADAWENLGREP